MNAANHKVEGNAKVTMLYMALELSNKRASLGVRRTLISARAMSRSDPMSG